MGTFLLALTENDKKLIIAIVLFFIVILAVLILICLLVKKVCKEQAKKVGTLMHDLVYAGVITSSKQFKKVAGYKNRVTFFKEARIPFLIILVSLIASFIYMGCTGNWNFAALFSDYGEKVSDGIYTGGTGFATILYLWDYSAFPTTTIFGMTVISDWAPLLQVPHAEITALFSYFFCIAFVVGLGWFAFTIQAFAARTYKIYQLANSIYEKSLDNTKFDDIFHVKYVNGQLIKSNQDQNTNNQQQNQSNNQNQPVPPAPAPDQNQNQYNNQNTQQ